MRKITLHLVQLCAVEIQASHDPLHMIEVLTTETFQLSNLERHHRLCGGAFNL